MSEPGTTDADLDGDGINETVLIDSDGDGFADTAVSTDPSGGFDVASDTDGDGYIDTVALDTDGDGFPDVSMSDTDGDGALDTTASDLDGDAIIDVVEYDADADGQPDEISIPGQTLTLDASGHVVAITTDPVPGETAPTDPTAPDPTAPDPTAPDPYAEDPSASYPDVAVDDVNGTDGTVSEGGVTDDGGVTQVDPDATERVDDAQNWFEQSENGFCVPASVAQIVAEYSDQPVTEAEFVDRAIELGYLTYDDSAGLWSGLTIQQGADLLESFGVQATVQTANIDSLDSYLDQGYNAIAYIDSSVVWSGDTPGALDHAVVVSSIENGMVYLNDPGTPNGQLEPVPVEVFEQAWSASNDQMIVTDNPDTGSSGTPGVGPDVYVAPDSTQGGYPVEVPVGAAGTDASLGSLAGASAGTVILPIVLSGEAVQAWHQLHG